MKKLKNKLIFIIQSLAIKILNKTGYKPKFEVADIKCHIQGLPFNKDYFPDKPDYTPTMYQVIYEDITDDYPNKSNYLKKYPGKFGWVIQHIVETKDIINLEQKDDVKHVYLEDDEDNMYHIVKTIDKLLKYQLDSIKLKL